MLIDLPCRICTNHFFLKKDDLLLSLSFLALAPDKLPREASTRIEGEVVIQNMLYHWMSVPY